VLSVSAGLRPQADVRIIASTKRNLLEKIGEGTFREDLYYRLDVLRINIPSLAKGSTTCRCWPNICSSESPANVLVYHARGDRTPHPTRLAGNVRELHHTLERAYLIGGGQVTAEVLAGEMGSPETAPRPSLGGFQAAIDHAEKQLLQEALRNSNGNKSAARRRTRHEALDVSRQTGQARAGIISWYHSQSKGVAPIACLSGRRSRKSRYPDSLSIGAAKPQEGSPDSLSIGAAKAARGAS